MDIAYATVWIPDSKTENGVAKVRSYSQMKPMKREALQQINRRASEMNIDEVPSGSCSRGYWHGFLQ